MRATAGCGSTAADRWYMVGAAADTQNTGASATRTLPCSSWNVCAAKTRSVWKSRLGPVTPKLSTLSSPARGRDRPAEHGDGNQSTPLAVDSDGVEGLRVGMNVQTPPSTRVVVDLDKACKFELVPGSDNQIVREVCTRVASRRRAPAVRGEGLPAVVARRPNLTRGRVRR